MTLTGLVERDSELSALADVVERGVVGLGGLVVVEGPAGIGKTRLLDEAAARAAAGGVRVLRARGGVLEQDVAYGAVRQLLERILAALPDEDRGDVLAGAAAHALPALAPATPAATGAGPAPATEHGLFWTVAHLAERVPLLLVLDDVQWFDAASLRFVVYLARRLVDLPVVVAVGLRPDDAAPAPELLAELLLEPGAVLLRPAPLSVAGIGSLLADRMGGEVAPEFAASCHHAVRGNPFLLTQLAGALVADGAQPTAAQAPRVREVRPRTVARAILLRLARLPAGSTELAQALAVLGAATTPDQVAVLAGVDPAAAGPALDRMVAEEILTGDLVLEFAHPVVREAVYAELGGTERAAWHQRAADLLLAEGAEAERIAPHLLATGAAGRADTVEVLRAAARTASERGAPDIAMRYLARALAEPVPESRADLLVESGRAGFHAGVPGDGPRVQLEEALALIEAPEDRRDVWLLLSQVTAMESSVPGSVAVLEEALDDLADLDPTALAPVLNELCGFGITHPETFERAVARLPAVPPSDGETLADRLALCNLANLAGFRGDSAAETERLAHLALAGGQLVEDLGAGSNTLHQFAYVLATIDPTKGPEMRIEDLALAEGRASGSAFAIAGALGTRSITSYLRGDLVEAEADAELALAVPGVPPFVLPAISGFVCLALVERDELDRAEALLALGGCGPELPEILHMHFAFWARSRLRSAQGRWAEAFADLEEFGRRAERVQLRTPVVPWLSDAALVLTRLGRPDQAVLRAEEYDARARAWGTPRVVGISARTRGLLAGGDHGRKLLEEAVRLHAGSPARLELATSLAELGAAERRAGDRTRAIETLDRAAEEARTCGATRLLRRVHEELAVAGATGRRDAVVGAESLTPGELRVARMAAEGQTNREIAESLFVSAKTVENQLGRVYAKLGITSRTALPEGLSGPDAPG